MRGAVYVNGTITPADDGRHSGLRSRVRVRRRRLRRRCAPTTACRFSTTGTSRGCAALRATSTSTCRSTTRRCARGSTRHAAAAGARRDTYIRILLTRGVGELTYDVARHAGAIARDHRQAAGRRAGARAHRRHPDLARADPPQPSRLGEPDHQVEQPAEQRARDAGSAPPRRRRSADVQLSRRAVRVLAVELLHRAGRRRADAEVGGRAARGHHAGVPVRGRPERSAWRSKDATLVPADLETADEVFITSTTREISPVVRIDDRVIGNGRPGRSRSNCGTRTTGAPWK